MSPTMAVERLIAIKRRFEMYLAGATPFANALFRDFLSWAEQNLGERQLQLIPLADLTAPISPISAVPPNPRIFAIYLKKQNTATAAYFMSFDDPANPNTPTEKRIQLPLLEGMREAIAFYADGLPFTTGLTLLSATAANGVGPSTSGDGPNGFVIIG